MRLYNVHLQILPYGSIRQKDRIIFEDWVLEIGGLGQGRELNRLCRLDRGLLKGSLRGYDRRCCTYGFSKNSMISF